MENHWMIVFPAALLASVVAAVVGTGGAVLLLPVLVTCFGIRDAVPIYAVAQLIGNGGRICLNREELRPKVAGWFIVGAVPSAVFGSWLFTKLPDSGLLKILGTFLLLTTIWRILRHGRPPGFPIERFSPLGAAFGLISSIVGSAGPFVAPFYLSFGLAKGAFIGTEAMGTAVMHVTKLVSYQAMGAMSSSIYFNGLFLGPVMLLGAFLGKKIVDRIPVHLFVRVIDLVVGGYGIWFLWK